MKPLATLVRTEVATDKGDVGVHHIHRDMLRNASTFSRAWETIQKYVRFALENDSKFDGAVIVRDLLRNFIRITDWDMT